MKNKKAIEVSSLTFLGLVIIILGSLLPKNSGMNFSMVVIVLGIFILFIAIFSFFKKNYDK
jgi:uncharacterized membrane protein